MSGDEEKMIGGLATESGNAKAPMWLNCLFDIHAQIVLPMDRFMCLYYIGFIDMYS